MRTLVAMSGGVDSSVAAALLVEEGRDVIGVTLKQWQGPRGEMPTAGCCTVADAEDARRVAAQLDIPYYVLDYTTEFRSAVVDRFGADYMAGRTPNPCVECNRRVRFRALLDRAADLSCDLMATGHHARVERRGGSYRLRRGADAAKDQSYVLHMLGQAELARVRLPIGHLTKAEVREHAARLGLRTAVKPDSQDICFVGSGDYREFLRGEFPSIAEPGPVIDTSGNLVATHHGTVDFTIGQRKGLGFAAGEPRYVVAIDAPARTVVVGTKADLESTACRLGEVSWVSGRAPVGGTRVDVKVRYRSAARPATVAPGRDGTCEVRFLAPERAVAPGQAAVFYDGDEVLGGGTILEAVSAASPAARLDARG